MRSATARSAAFTILLFFGTLAGRVQAQPQTGSQPEPPGQSAPAANPPTPSAKQGAEGTQQPLEENPKRILDIIPNFTTTNDTVVNQERLTPREKYNLAWHQMFDFSAHLGNAFQSAIQQASDGEPHYGQGWGAYGKRFAASEGDQVTSCFFIYGFLPTILKEDPRYFRQGRGRAWHRIYYAVSRTVITRKDSGEPAFNTPQVLGQLMQAGISNAYYPRQDRSVGGTFQDWGVNLAFNSGYNVLKEYFPDLLAWLRHRRKQTTTESRAEFLSSGTAQSQGAKP